MLRKLTLVLGVLTTPLAPSAFACGDYQPPPAVVKMDSNGHSIQQTTDVTIRGKVTFVRCLMFGKTSVGITAAGNTYWLDVRGNKRFTDMLNHAGDRTVVVSGELETIGTSQLVNVADLRIEDDSVVKTIRVDLRGKLQHDPREILRPFNVQWYVTVDGRDYYLHFSDKQDPDAAAPKLEGKRVRVLGTLEVHGRWNIVHVRDMSDDSIVGCGIPIP